MLTRRTLAGMMLITHRSSLAFQDASICIRTKHRLQLRQMEVSLVEQVIACYPKYVWQIKNVDVKTL